VTRTPQETHSLLEAVEFLNLMQTDADHQVRGADMSPHQIEAQNEIARFRSMIAGTEFEGMVGKESESK
jgi:hypothetical protein